LITVSGTNADNEACSTSVTIYRDAALPALSIAPLEIWVENHTADVTLDGTSSNVAGAIAWQNSASGVAGTVPNTWPFIIPTIALNVGTNYLVLSTSNLFAVTAVQTVTVYRTGGPTNFYVSPGGSDTTGNGSLANPWLTIAKAVSNAPNGTFMQPTLINVAAGTYSDSYNGQWILGVVNKSYFIIAGAGPTNTLLRRGSLTLSLPVVRIDNSGFTALRGLNLDMSSETVGWADDNSAIRVTTYNLVTLEDLWLKGPVSTSQRNGHAVQVVSATATRNFVARRVLLDGFGRGGYIMNNAATAANTILFDQCTFVNQAGTSAADDSIALWSRAGTTGTGRDGVLVREGAISSVRKGLAVDSTTG
ncbi:MAG: hypothetical protein NTV22_06505, partial [bacterium]|nr:hypothetical protein [bacterium]